MSYSEDKFFCAVDPSELVKSLGLFSECFYKHVKPYYKKKLTILRVIKTLKTSCVMVLYELLNWYNKHLAADPGNYHNSETTKSIHLNVSSATLMLGCEKHYSYYYCGVVCFAFLWGRKSTVITVDLILVRNRKNFFPVQVQGVFWIINTLDQESLL